MNPQKEDVMRCFTTLVEMLQDRGVTDGAALQKFQALEMEALLKTKSVFTVPVKDDLQILFYLLPKVKQSELSKFLDKMDPQAKVPHYILVVREKPKLPIEIPNAVQELFEMKELMYNITQHVLVPKHQRLPETEVPELLAKMNIKSKLQLPHILKADPMARYLGLRPGEIVKISRVSPTAGAYVNYRVCV